MAPELPPRRCDRRSGPGACLPAQGVLLLLGLLLVGTAGSLAYESWFGYQGSLMPRAADQGAWLLGAAASLRALERDKVSTLLGREHSPTAEEWRTLRQLRKRADRAWEDAVARISRLADDGAPAAAAVLDAERSSYDKFLEARWRVDQLLRGSGSPAELGEWFNTIAEANDQNMFSRVALSSIAVHGAGAAPYRTLWQWSWMAADAAEQARGLVVAHISAQTPMEFARLAQLDRLRRRTERLVRLLHATFRYGADDPKAAEAVGAVQRALTADTRLLALDAYEAITGGEGMRLDAEWLSEGVALVDSLMEVSRATGQSVARYTDTTTRHDGRITVAAAGVALLGLVLTVTGYRRIQAIARSAV